MGENERVVEGFNGQVERFGDVEADPCGRNIWQEDGLRKNSKQVLILR